MEKYDKSFFLLNAFADYEIESTVNYCYLNEDGEFVNKEKINRYPVDGGKLMDVLADLIKNPDCIGFKVDKNNFTINHFDPNTGEDATYILTILDYVGK